MSLRFLLELGCAALALGIIVFLMVWKRQKTKRYTMYHRTTFDLALMLHGEIPSTVLSRDYVKVAEVIAHDLEEVFRRTNTIEFYWWEDPKVVRSEPIAYRSTSVGDVITQGKRVWVVASCGFAQAAWAEGSYHPAVSQEDPPTSGPGAEAHGWWLPIEVRDEEEAEEGDQE